MRDFIKLWNKEKKYALTFIKYKIHQCSNYLTKQYGSWPKEHLPSFQLIQISRRPCLHSSWATTLQFLDLVFLEWGLKFEFFNKFSGDTHAIGPRPKVLELLG